MILTALIVATRPQLAPPIPAPLVGVRSLALSPDGSRIAFTYLGDVWVAPSAGGKAVPVTNHVEMDDNPVWSPDGKWIAFATNRHGSTDVYVVPADGGQSRRLTSFSNTEIPSDFSPDGKQVLYRNWREKTYNGVYGIDVNTGKLTEYFLDPDVLSNPKFSGDGRSLVYNRTGFPWTRPRYQGSAAAQLCRYDLATGIRVQLRDNGFQHLWPNVLPTGEILTVTVEEKTPSTASVGVVLAKNQDSPKRTPNAYLVDAKGTARRLTDYSGGGVRFLTTSRDGRSMAYEYEGDVFVGAVGAKAQKVAFTAVLDDKLSRDERLVLKDGADSSVLSADGATAVFTVRGELWKVPTKKGKGPNAEDATQLTSWAGLDGQPLLTPDGKTAFLVSDREGANRLYRLDLATNEVKPVTTDDHDVERLKLTPDKKSVSFWKVGKPGGLFTVPVEGGVPTRVVEASSSESRDYAFSPDMKWLALEEPLLRSGYYYWENAQNVVVRDLATGKQIDVTQASAPHGSPVWSADGKYLYCLSDRDGEGVYAIPLKEEDARASEIELKYEKPKGPVTVDIDFSGIEKRFRKLVAAPGVAQVISDPETGELVYLAQGDYWRASYAGEDAKKLTNGAGFGPGHLSGDGKLVHAVRNGVPSNLDLRGPGNPVTPVSFRADWTRDVLAERKAAFDQFWRAYNRGFYDPNFHGRDWLAIRSRYEKLLPGVGHRNEMATLLNMMVGELEASHTEAAAGPGNPKVQQTGHLGVTYDYSWEGLGVKVLEVPERSQGRYAKSKLSPGDIIEQVHGVTASLTDSFLHRALAEQAGRDVSLKVRGKDGNLRDVKLRAVTNNAFYDLTADNRFEARRQAVEKLSGGSLAYVHIAGMGQGELRRFNLEVWQRSQGKKGLVIDVRENGGGNTGDLIIDMLERLPNAFYAPRDEAPVAGPGQALGIPIVVMCDLTSFSNAEMFPAAMKARKLATLVGSPTPGYVIYTYGLRLIDGTVARMPQTGAWRLDGQPLENNGVVPDVVVPWSVADRLAGNDVQLAKAVEVLLGKR